MAQLPRAASRLSASTLLLALCLLMPALPSAVAAPRLNVPSPAAVAAAQAQPCMDFARKAAVAPATLGAPLSNIGYDAGASLVLATQANVSDAAGAPDLTVNRAVLRQLRQILKPDWGATAVPPGSIGEPVPRCRVIANTARGEASEPTAAGGLSAQDDLWATSMMVLARFTPSVWRELADWERARLDLIMRAELISNAFVMSDNNPFVKSGQPQRGIDGDTNVNRSWSPAYGREGMLGNVLMAVAYFGAPRVAGDPASRDASGELANWGRGVFLRMVSSRRMNNLKETFGGGTVALALPWTEDPSGALPKPVPNANANAPTDGEIRAALTNWTFTMPGAAPGSIGYRVPITEPERLYAAMTAGTFDRPLACGLAGGAGISAKTATGTMLAGRLETPSACALPYPEGTAGMIHDFDGTASGAPRSAASSAYADFKANLATQVGMLSAGLWHQDSIPGTSTSGLDITARKRVGTDDLFRKLELGYVGVNTGQAVPAPGAPGGGYVQRLSPAGSYGDGYGYTRSLWEDAVLGAPQIGNLPRPSASVVNTAIAEVHGQLCVDYGRSIGATSPAKIVATDRLGRTLSNINSSAGASLVLAVAAHEGDVAAGDALMKQVAFTLHGPYADIPSDPDCIPSNRGTPTGDNPVLGSQEPTAGSGLTAQDELWMTSALLIARRTPQLWERIRALPGGEAKVDLIMEATLVANAYVMSDQNPQVLALRTQTSIDGNGNISRYWGPNYREGMYGSLLVAAAYFGSDRTREILGAWSTNPGDPSKFGRDVLVARARALHLDNLVRTFDASAAADPPVAPGQTSAPTNAEIAGALSPSSWSFDLEPASSAPAAQHLRLTLPAAGDPRGMKPFAMKLQRFLTEDTYGGKVSCGLWNSYPVTSADSTTTWWALGLPLTSPVPVNAGRVASGGCTNFAPTKNPSDGPKDPDGHPLLGVPLGTPGMLAEFASADAQGQRSSIVYAYMGFKASVASTLGLIAAGVWTPGTIPAAGTRPASQTSALIALRRVGVDDLFRKLDLGYISYSNGRVERPPMFAAPTAIVPRTTTPTPTPTPVPSPTSAADFVQTRLQPGNAYRDGYLYTESLFRDTLAASAAAR